MFVLEGNPRFLPIYQILETHQCKLLYGWFLPVPQSNFSTPAVVQYQNQLPSNAKGVMLVGMRQRFSEVSEERALLLHDVLEAVERCGYEIESYQSITTESLCYLMIQNMNNNWLCYKFPILPILTENGWEKYKTNFLTCRRKAVCIEPSAKWEWKV